MIVRVLIVLAKDICFVNTVGKKSHDGIVELQKRGTDSTDELTVEELVQRLRVSSNVPSEK